jgi:diguanylate cyclase (GGDEF)-like protein
MHILAITQNSTLLERLGAIVGPGGHTLAVAADPLQALASEACGPAQLILVDAAGDPLDGFRFCHLLRAESRVLFRHLPIYIILDHAPRDEDRDRLKQVEADGFIEGDATLHKLRGVLGPLVSGAAPLRQEPLVPVLACDLTEDLLRTLRVAVEPIGFGLRACTPAELPEAIASGRPPILFLGVDPTGAEARAVLDSLAELDHPPYPILVGRPGPDLLHPLLGAVDLDWLDLPLAAPLIRHGVRRALEWRHSKRIQREYHQQISELLERRSHLESEADALRSEVLTDPLTELLNRRAFNQHLEHAVNQWARHARPFVLILSDLDYFKLINDRFGHLVGDQVLRAVAQRIKASLRRSDLAFRIGGEEFAILLTETQISAALDVADKIRRRIDETPVSLVSGQSVFPTMSFGVGGPNGDDPGSLFARVDQALYAAKHKGRNRVELA